MGEALMAATGEAVIDGGLWRDFVTVESNYGVRCFLGLVSRPVLILTFRL